MVPAAAVIPSLRVYFDIAAVIALLVDIDEKGRDLIALLVRIAGP